MGRTEGITRIAFTAACVVRAAVAQNDLPPPNLAEHGLTMMAGNPVTYVVHRLPVSSFPDLPAQVALELTARGCVIPQSYAAHHPENVIHGSFAHPGSSDWAALCLKNGVVALLVFFGDPNAGPVELSHMQEQSRLSARDPAGQLGFNWVIGSATPQQVHDAQAGLQPRPRPLNHDALVDETVNGRAVYRYFEQGRWTQVDMPAE